MSITDLTQAQCNAMQSQFYRYALPKMGLNRNTPKAIIHGPREFGGCGIFDIYTEHTIQRIRQIQKHIRRNDNVEKFS